MALGSNTAEKSFNCLWLWLPLKFLKTWQKNFVCVTKKAAMSICIRKYSYIPSDFLSLDLAPCVHKQVSTFFSLLMNKSWMNQTGAQIELSYTWHIIQSVPLFHAAGDRRRIFHRLNSRSQFLNEIHNTDVSILEEGQTYSLFVWLIKYGSEPVAISHIVWCEEFHTRNSDFPPTLQSMRIYSTM